MLIKKILTHFHFCCGLGGGAKGFNEAKPIVGNMQAEWECLGGVDVDPAGLADFKRLTGVEGTQLDLFTREQYIRFHGKEPPAGWREATTEDIRRAAQNRWPDTVFISSPCKGASGLLSEKMSATPKYQALNELTLRCIWLMAETWRDDPVPMLVFENVPRLANRGRHLLDQIGALLSHYGYAVAETTHDCGVIGGLAQSRKRFLLVARHVEKVPPFLYEPEKKSLRSVGDILSRMPLAGDIERAGPMHRVPALQWKTWVRLALVEAGKDWRSLNNLAIQDGYLRDLVIVPDIERDIWGCMAGTKVWARWLDDRTQQTGRSRWLIRVPGQAPCNISSTVFAGGKIPAAPSLASRAQGKAHSVSLIPERPRCARVANPTCLAGTTAWCLCMASREVSMTTAGGTLPAPSSQALTRSSPASSNRSTGPGTGPSRPWSWRRSRALSSQRSSWNWTG